MPAIASNNSPKVAFGHVNLMIDSFIANASANDLRALLRETLTTSPPETTVAFTELARKRMTRSAKKITRSPKDMFTLVNGSAKPAKGLQDVLSTARSLYGVGMGFASLGVLTALVTATAGLRWEEDGEMAETLAAIDGDISQGIQSSKEEVAGGRAADLTRARATVSELKDAIIECYRDVESWGGSFPFEKALMSIQYWKL